MVATRLQPLGNNVIISRFSGIMQSRYSLESKPYPPPKKDHSAPEPSPRTDPSRPEVESSQHRGRS